MASSHIPFSHSTNLTADGICTFAYIDRMLVTINELHGEGKSLGVREILQ